MLQRSTIQLLRFHFSFFLLPVYLFAVSQVPVIDRSNAIIVFLILHILVYPSSNGYNSYMDKDESPIGGLASPLQPTKQLFYASIIMDVMAVVFAVLVDPFFALGILLYILASRAYSYRGIRLKRFPVIGFLTVFIFQGAVIFIIVYHTVNSAHSFDIPVLPCIISSMLIGALYPLTQIYQHEDDFKDGVITVSYLVGKKGSFIFSMILFLSATFLMYLRFQTMDQLNYFNLYLLIMLPVVSFFLYWMLKTWRNPEAANFRNSLLMNVIATVCTTIFFITILIMNH
jgi:1,4-dihydroxy-2-naphthoate octaprenyltransferase